MKPWSLQHLDRAGVVMYHEGDARSMFGRREKVVVGMAIADLVHEQDRSALENIWTQLLAEPGCTRTLRQRFAHPNGKSVWVETIAINHLDAPDGFILAIHLDLTVEIANEIEAAATEFRFRTLADEMSIGVFECDAGGVVLYGNSYFTREVTKVGSHILDVVAPDETSRFVDAWMSLSENTGSDGFIIDVQSVDGRILHIRAHTVRATARAATSVCRITDGPEGADGSPVGGPLGSVVGSVEDVTDAQQETQSLRHEADRDALTGLHHRAGLRRAWEAADVESYAVLFIDLDGFKEINDHFGHATGDAVLVEAAQRLRHAVRPSDFVCRYGGDEFVIVLSDVRDSQQMQRLALRTQAAVEGPMSLPGDLTAMIRASTGCALAKRNDTLDSVVARADENMYEKKRKRSQKSTVGSSTLDPTAGGQRSARPASRSR